MREAFVSALRQAAQRDGRVVVLTADLGYSVLEPFAACFPNRFVNVGVAEQNMLGIATGLAESGYVPFVYSITPFAVLRPFEFIRNGAVQHHLAVRIVGVGGGFDYGSNGLSHHALEDVAILRTQPGMTVVCPADGPQMTAALNATLDLPGPVYYRIGKEDRPPVADLDGRFRLARAEVIGRGRDILLITTGGITHEARHAQDLLEMRGVGVTLVVAACIAPAPTQDLVTILRRFPLVVTIEAHYTTGGLGSMIAEIIADHGLGCRLVRRGVQGHIPDGISGSSRFMLERHGLSAAQLADGLVQVLSEMTLQYSLAES